MSSGGSNRENADKKGSGVGPIRVSYPQPHVAQAPDGTLTIHINLNVEQANGQISGQQAQLTSQQAQSAAPSSSSAANGEKKGFFVDKANWRSSTIAPVPPRENFALECPVCNNLYVGGVAIQCGHMICEPCFTRVQRSVRFRRVCPICRFKITPKRAFKCFQNKIVKR